MAAPSNFCDFPTLFSNYPVLLMLECENIMHKVKKLVKGDLTN